MYRRVGNLIPLDYTIDLKQYTKKILNDKKIQLQCRYLLEGIKILILFKMITMTIRRVSRLITADI